MTVIGLCGLRGGGKSAVADVLARDQKFIRLQLVDGQETLVLNGVSSLDMAEDGNAGGLVRFADLQTAVDYVTSNWQQNFVVENLQSLEQFEAFMKRPFFVVVGLQSPVHVRYTRYRQQRGWTGGLEAFVEEDDRALFGRGLIHVISRARLVISNAKDDLKGLADQVLRLNLFHDQWIRPSWDAYFMEMAELASSRSNCMKRRVGAVVVKDKRVVATGYNGTARGLLNCCEGGCGRCNANARCGQGLEHCYCLHAEENALLEAGRIRAEDATIYCTTVPCLGCSQKIIQCGISRVVYAREYSIEHDASAMLQGVGVVLEKFARTVPHYVEMD